MKRLWFVLLPAAVLIAAPAAASIRPPDPATLTREAALTADVGTLAHDALAVIAARFVEVERPTFSGFQGPDAPLGGLRFATAAESAGWPGLCKATVVWVDLVDPHSPAQTSTVYSVVDDLAPLPDMWNDAYGAALQRKCAQAGRVIPTESGDLGQAVFFSLEEGDRDFIWGASRALQLAISSAATGTGVLCVEDPDDLAEIDGSGPPDRWLEELGPDDPEVVENHQNRTACDQPAATVAGLSLDRIISIDIAPCPGAGQDQHCVEAEFLRYAVQNRRVGWLVTLQYRDGADFHGDDIADVFDIRLTPSWAIYD